MTAEIPVAQLEGFLEKPEVGLVGLVEHGEDPETNPLVDGVVQELGWVWGVHRFDWILIPVTTPASAALNERARTG